MSDMLQLVVTFARLNLHWNSDPSFLKCVSNMRYRKVVLTPF